MQTAYSAILQARDLHAEFVFLQSAKLLKATDQPYKAIQDIDNALKIKIPSNFMLDTFKDSGIHPIITPEGPPGPLAKVGLGVSVCTKAWLIRCQSGFSSANSLDARSRPSRKYGSRACLCRSNQAGSQVSSSSSLPGQPLTLLSGRWESPYYYLGRYHDACAEERLAKIKGAKKDPAASR